jgi:hypothetical protein
LRVIASLASLIANLRSMSSDAIDPQAIGVEWTTRLAAGLRHATAVRDARTAGAPVFDMHFRDFIRDELAMVRRIYAHFDLELTGEAETRMRRFLAANPKDKHGAHRYALADSGLDAVTERARYREYQERYAIEAESTASA